MYVMKDKDIVMTGHCKYRDDLWEILVHKTQIKMDNYITPIPHPNIYPSRIPLAH